ncbi:MAG TPA: methyltransferase domain-containing protein [Bacteroidales bacterium]|nr:methyltransferase domain-containing protein [Bacteroidales bacterium]
METRKARKRRLEENFFQKYCNGRGIDIGCGNDPLLPNIDKWDFSISPDQDATYMKGIPDNTYDFVYSSHCLEDLSRPDIAIKNWWRILKNGGYLIIFVPHRDLFELRKTLPSAGNVNHRWYFVIDKNEPPVTIGLIPFIVDNLTDYDIIYVKKCDDNYSYYIKDEKYVIASGEFSIEAVIKKGNKTKYID